MKFSAVTNSASETNGIPVKKPALFESGKAGRVRRVPGMTCSFKPKKWWAAGFLGTFYP